MTRLLISCANFLGRPRGVAFTFAILGLGSIYAYYVDEGVVTYWLSVAAIIWGALILLSSGRSEMALHAKLDELIRVSNARNELIGLQNKDLEEVEEKANVKETA